MIWENCTTDDATYEALRSELVRRQGDKPFPMQLNGTDYAVFAQTWNMGIDSHLEALTERSTVKQVGHRVHVSIHPEELPVLVRRLFELGENDDSEDYDDEKPDSLARSILYCVGLED